MVSADVDHAPAQTRTRGLALARAFGGGIAPTRPVVVQGQMQLFAAAFGSQVRVYHVTQGSPALERSIQLPPALLRSAVSAGITAKAALTLANSFVKGYAGNPAIVALQGNPLNQRQVFVLPSNSRSFFLYDIVSGKRVKTWSVQEAAAGDNTAAKGAKKNSSAQQKKTSTSTSSKDSNTSLEPEELAVQVITGLTVAPGETNSVYISLRRIYTHTPKSAAKTPTDTNIRVLADNHSIQRFNLADSSMTPVGTASANEFEHFNTVQKPMALERLANIGSNGSLTELEIQQSYLLEQQQRINVEDTNDTANVSNPINKFSVSDDHSKVVVSRGNYVEIVEFNRDITTLISNNNNNNQGNNTPKQNKKKAGKSGTNSKDETIASSLAPISESIVVLNPNNSSEKVATIEIHPQGKFVAVGSSTGKIHLLHVFGKKSSSTLDKSFRTSLHWHASSVNDIAFSSDGQQLISGGKETVLVIWQIDTRQKRFLPRLGGEIFTVSYLPDQKSFAVTLRNSIIHFISQQNLKIWMTLGNANIDDSFAPTKDITENDTISKEEKESLRQQMIRCQSPLVSQARGLVLLREPTGIQLLDTSSFDISTATRINIIPKIHTANTSQQRDSPKGNVDHVSSSPDGNWLITVERYTNPLLDSAISKINQSNKDLNISLPHALNAQRRSVIKFWFYQGAQNKFNGDIFQHQQQTQSSSNSFTLSALVNETESTHGPITGAAVSQLGRSDILNSSGQQHTEYFAATGYKDGTIKIWRNVVSNNTNNGGLSTYEDSLLMDEQLTQSQQQQQQQLNLNSTSGWVCITQGSYAKNIELTGFEFSKDGAVLSTISDNVLILWSPKTGDILDHFELRSTIVRTIFLDDGRIVTLLSSGSICVIDLLSRCIIYEISGSFTHVAASATKNSNFVAISSNVPQRPLDDTNVSAQKTKKSSSKSKNDAMDLDTEPDNTQTGSTLYIFESSTPTPCAATVLGGEIEATTGSSKILGLTTVPNTNVLSGGSDSIVVLYEQSAVEVYNETELGEREQQQEKEAQKTIDRLQSLFLEPTRDPEDSKTVAISASEHASEITSAFGNAASHMLPAPSRLVSGFLRAALDASSR